MSPNRIVALLTPLVFAPLAGAIATWVAENFPGVEVSSSALEEIFIAGALIALAPAAQWLHGWQKWEEREANAAAAAEEADLPVAADMAAEADLGDAELADDAFGFEDADELDAVFSEADAEDLAALEDLEDPLLNGEEPVRAGG